MSYLKRQEPNFVKSLSKALSIMEFIGEKNNAASLAEISAELGIAKSTAHGLLYTLSECGYVKQDGEKGKYILDLKLFELGQIVYESLDLKTASHKYLNELLELFGETVQLGILSGGEVVYLDKLQGIHAISSISRVGSRLVSYCTGLGKVLLSGLDETTIRGLLNELKMKPYTVNTITNFNDLFAELQMIRKLGYGMDNEEIEIGLRCIAAPIYDNTGKIVAAVSISGPTTRINSDHMEELISGVKHCCQQISRELGYKG